MKRVKEIEVQITMLLKEYEELEKYVSDLDVDEKKFKYYLLMDKIYFLGAVVENSRKRTYSKQLDELLDSVEKSYSREVLSNERASIVESGNIELSELRTYPTSVGEELQKGVYECRVIYEDQINILTKYIGLGKKDLGENEIKEDIKNYLLSGNVDNLENVSELDKQIIKVLLDK